MISILFLGNVSKMFRDRNMKTDLVFLLCNLNVKLLWFNFFLFKVYVCAHACVCTRVCDFFTPNVSSSLLQAFLCK